MPASFLPAEKVKGERRTDRASHVRFPGFRASCPSASAAAKVRCDRSDKPAVDTPAVVTLISFSKERPVQERERERERGEERRVGDTRVFLQTRGRKEGCECVYVCACGYVCWYESREGRLKVLSKKGISIHWSGTIGSGTPPRNRASTLFPFFTLSSLLVFPYSFNLVTYHLSFLPTFLIHSLRFSFSVSLSCSLSTCIFYVFPSVLRLGSTLPRFRYFACVLSLPPCDFQR